jgi:hypothetical protein
MITAKTLRLAKLEFILAAILGSLLWLFDFVIDGPWWLLVGFVVWTITRGFDKIVGWPREKDS